MKSFIALALLLGAIATANADVAPGLYSLENVGFRTAEQGTTFLGFNNKTCGDATSGQSAYLRPSNDGSQKLWKSWEITIVRYHSSGAPIATISTGVPSGKKIRCPGQLAAVNAGSCGSSTVDIDAETNQEWRLIAVSGEADTYKLVANDKSSGCARYLSASSSSSNLDVKLVTSGTSDLAQWKLTALALGTAVPSKPHIVAVTRGSGSDATTASVSFSAPKKPGCGPIVSYTITADPLTSGSTVTKTVSGTKTTTKITGLTANRKYNFTIEATNACGTSAETYYVETLAKSDGLIAAGYEWVCAIKADSSLKCFDYQSGDSYDATKVPFGWKKGIDAVSMAAGYYSTTVISRNGTVYGFGYQIYSSCTDYDSSSYCINEDFFYNAKYVHGWYDFQCITLKDGKASCFGESSVSSDDFEKLPGYHQFPQPDSNGLWGYLTGVEKLKAGYEVACAIYQNGDLACAAYSDDDSYWGEDGSGADVTLSWEWFKDVQDVGIGEDGICVVKTSGFMDCSSYDQPTESTYYTTLPIPDAFKQGGVARVECGYYSCCALKDNGDFTCWGAMTPQGSIDYSYDGMGGLPWYSVGVTKYTERCMMWKRRQLQSEAACLRWPIATEVVEFDVGYYTACYVHASGLVTCWGDEQPGSSGSSGENLWQLMGMAGYDRLW